MRGERGFTLLELLVAMALLALLAATLAGSLRFGARSWDAAAERGRAWSEVAAVQDFLRNTLGRAQPLPPRGGEERPPGFEGDMQRLRLVAPLGERFGPPGLYRLELAARPSATGLSLWLRWQILDDGEGSGAWGDGEWGDGSVQGHGGERLLLDGFERLAFAYRAAPAPDGTAAPWRNAWSAEEPPPRLLRLEGARPLSGRESWIPLLLPLRVEADARCRLPALAPLCGSGG